ncbi:MAG: NAD(+)/NADH kinase [Chloroflexota bacterium]
MDTIGVVYHPQKEEARLLALTVQSWLEAQGRTTWLARGYDGEADEAELQEQLPHTSLLVVLGGDGATLRAARMAAPLQVPLFSINMGRVGFLSEAQVDNWKGRLQRVLDGECWLEHRLMLRARLERQSETIAHFEALNDVVVGRGAQARVLRLNLYVDGNLVTTYTADAIVVATPTGSTAYALAAGGPLLPPQLLNYLVIPVAPHLSLDRAVILHEEAVVSIEVEMEHEATVAADGQYTTPLQNHDRVLINKHEDQTLFARVGSPTYFYHRLMERLGFWHPKGLE